MALLTITDEKPDNKIADLLRAVVDSATQEFSPLKFEGEYPESGFGIGELRPKQLGQANNYWQYTVTTSFADWVNKTLGQNVYIVITGLFNLTIDPATTEIYPTANGKNLPYMNIEQLFSYRDSRAWFTKPFATGPNNNLTVQAIGRVGQTERQGLLGFAVAKRSYLISAAP